MAKTSQEKVVRSAMVTAELRTARAMPDWDFAQAAAKNYVRSEAVQEVVVEALERGVPLTDVEGLYELTNQEALAAVYLLVSAFHQNRFASLLSEAKNLAAELVQKQEQVDRDADNRKHWEQLHLGAIYPDGYVADLASGEVLADPSSESVDGLRDQVVELTDQVSRHKTAEKALSKAIDRLQDQLQRQKGLLEQEKRLHAVTHNTLAKAKQRIQELEDQVMAAFRLSQERAAALGRQAESLGNLESQVGLRDERLKIADKLLASRDEQLDNQRGKIQYLESRLEETGKELKERSDRVEALQIELALRSKHLIDRNQQLVDLRGDLNSRLAKIQDLSERLRQAQHATDTVQARLDMLLSLRRVEDPNDLEELVSKVHGILNEALALFERKNKEYGNAIWATGVHGAVTAITGDVARLRTMTTGANVPDWGNVRDKFIDTLVQAAIGILMVDSENYSGKEV